MAAMALRGQMPPLSRATQAQNHTISARKALRKERKKT